MHPHVVSGQQASYAGVPVAAQSSQLRKPNDPVMVTGAKAAQYFASLAIAGLVIWKAPGWWKAGAVVPAYWGLAGLGWLPSLDITSVVTKVEGIAGAQAMGADAFSVINTVAEKVMEVAAL